MYSKRKFKINHAGRLCKLTSLKWFPYSQNNSGGKFVNNDSVSEFVLIQAKNADKANTRMERITEPFGDFCFCCGQRWYIDCVDDDGAIEPKLWGKPLNKQQLFDLDNNIVLHHFDGRITKTKGSNTSWITRR